MGWITTQDGRHIFIGDESQGEKPSAQQPAKPAEKNGYKGKINHAADVGFGQKEQPSAENQTAAWLAAHGVRASIEEVVAAAIPDHTIFPEVTLTAKSYGLSIEARGSNGAIASRYLSRDGAEGKGDLVIHNDAFGLPAAMQAQGKGSDFFHQQVLGAESLGVARIETTASRSSKMNGYYTWPRLGYDGHFSITTTDRLGLPVGLQKATHVSQLMSSQAGRDWWKANGKSIDVSFDPRAGSPNRMVLDAYMAERGTRAKG